MRGSQYVSVLSLELRTDRYQIGESMKIPYFNSHVGPYVWLYLDSLLDPSHSTQAEIRACSKMQLRTAQFPNRFWILDPQTCTQHAKCS